MSTSRRGPQAARKELMWSRTLSFDREVVGEPFDRKSEAGSDAMMDFAALNDGGRFNDVHAGLFEISISLPILAILLLCLSLSRHMNS